MIEVQDLTKTFGTHTALRDLSFVAQHGRCTGFLGPNGAGKTTTIRILTGMARPTAGRTAVAGYDVTKEPQQVRRRVGYLPQTPAFYTWMTGEEVMRYTADLLGLSPSVARERTKTLLSRLGIDQACKRAAGSYSGGMKQRLGIAQALLGQPELLILDEPVSALDPVGRHEILALIQELKQETTIFMCTHVLSDVERVCDDVVIVQNGSALIQSSVADLQKRYATEVIELEVAGVDIRAALADLPYVAGVEEVGKRLHVVARDLNAAQELLPAFLVANGAKLVHYSMRTPTLEDIFLQVVNAS